MSQSEAIARARTLRESLLDHGVSRVSIELVAGRGSGGWSDSRFVGTLGHHIVSRRSQGVTPFLHLVKVGRSDLPGPLCNGYGGWDEVARIICMGWANHPGAGGPMVVEAGTIPRNNGRPYLFGWEFEGGVDAADWSDSYRQFMAACLAGTLAWLGRTELSHAEHKTWAPTRKVDRLDYSLTVARDEIAEQLQGDEMAIDQKYHKTLEDLAYAVQSRQSHGSALGFLIDDIRKDIITKDELEAALKEVAAPSGDVEAIAEAVIAKIVARLGS